MARSGFTGGLVAIVVAAACAPACGDDDPADTGTGGTSGNAGKGGTTSKGGSAGKGGNAGKGGSSGKGGSAGTGDGTGGSKAGEGSGGSGDDAGSGGTGAVGEGESGGSGHSNGVGGEGGTDHPPVGGAAGETNAGAGGEPGVEPSLAAISKLHDEVFTAVSDLRGLRYAANGKLWASGHLGINANPSPAGQVDKRVVIARFDADGTPDTTFSGDGFLELNLVSRVEDATDPQNVLVVNDGNEESYGIVELGSGDIIVQANARDTNGKGMDVLLARFTAAGDPVTAFGTNGVARVTFGWETTDDAIWTASGAPSDTSWGIELDGSGSEAKIVVFGFGSAAKGQTTGNPAAQRTDNDRFITRVLASSGAVDPGFNAGKAFFYNTGGTNSDGGRRGRVLADGSILSAGYTSFTPGGNHVVVIKLKSDGTRDAAFGHIANDRGIIRSNPLIDDGGVAECYSLAIQSNGRLITTGYGAATAANTSSRFGYQTTQGPDLISLAFKADGSALDTAWGNQGMFVGQSEESAPERMEERGRDLLALPDDRLVYVGNYATDPAIYVVTPEGEFDPTNGVGALFRYTPLTTTTSGTNVSTSHFYRVVLSPDGRHIAATTNQNVDGVKLAILEIAAE